jgi:spore coat protein U-like protein
VKLINVLTLFLFLLCAQMAQAQECRVVTSDVSFGNYDTFSKSPLDATGRVTVACDGSLPFTIKLDKGMNSRGSFNPRVLRAAGTDSGLNYNLFTDSVREKIWGDGTGNTFVGGGTANRIQTQFTVYGRIPAAQNVPVGTYVDRINVTVEW